MRRAIAAAIAFVCALGLGGVARGATGDLSDGACLSGDTATGSAGTSACAQVPLPTAGGTDSGLDSIQSVDISSNGNSIYATAQGDDAIVHLEREAGTGAITFSECVTGGTSSGPVLGGGTGACEASPTAVAGASNTGFDDLIDAVVSPDGTSVYAISQNDDAVVQFDRNTGTGTLAFVECYSAEEASTATGGGPCEDTPTETVSGSDSGLDSPSGIAVSPNGQTVYVTSSLDDSIAGFARNTGDGSLTYGGCITGEIASGPAGPNTSCAAAPKITAGGAESGLDQAFTPVVSDDGKSLYLGSSEDDAVAWFDRNTANGLLTFNDCITGETGTGPTGTGACGTAVPTATGTGTGSGMDRVQSLAISPDDASIYAGAQNDSTVNHFTRNASTGDLTLAECLTGNQNVGPGCTEIPSATTFGDDSGLRAAQSLVVSPDGKGLYVAAAEDDAIAVFDRRLSDGDLAWAGCVTGEIETGPSGSGSCAAPGATVGGAASGLDLIRSVAVTPDGLELIGGAEQDDAIASAARSNAPETTIESSPPSITNDPTATFAFSTDEPGAVFRCRVDSAAFAPCSGSGTHTTGTLADGLHTFQVRAVNDAGSPDLTPASRSVLVDTVPPDTNLTAGPNGGVDSGDVQFEFAALNGGSTTQCSLDGEAFAACASPKAYVGLADGSHTFDVRSLDAAGNIDPTPAERSFSVDTANPDTLLDKQPAKTERTNKDRKRFTFRFSSTEGGATFECKRDKGKSWKDCKSPYAKKYKRGEHTFKVRSIDAVGNVDGSAASRTWKVKANK